jgi:hypothetical protein
LPYLEQLVLISPHAYGVTAAVLVEELLELGLEARLLFSEAFLPCSINITIRV